MVSLHAVFEEISTRSVVGLLIKLQLTAVFHEFFEFDWMIAAKLLKASLYLLLFDGVVLFIFAASWQTLPRQRASD